MGRVGHIFIRRMGQSWVNECNTDPRPIVHRSVHQDHGQTGGANRTDGDNTFFPETETFDQTQGSRVKTRDEPRHFSIRLRRDTRHHSNGRDIARHRQQDMRRAKTGLDRDKTVTLLKCLRLRYCQGTVSRTHYRLAIS